MLQRIEGHTDRERVWWTFILYYYYYYYIYIYIYIYIILMSQISCLIFFVHRLLSCSVFIVTSPISLPARSSVFCSFFLFESISMSWFPSAHAFSFLLSPCYCHGFRSRPFFERSSVRVRWFHLYLVLSYFLPLPN
jgi:hypothetical protein